MNAVTQCPACGTLFRVVDDQLRISQGWVRCGQCHEVFNAQVSLTSESLPQDPLSDLTGPTAAVGAMSAATSAAATFAESSGNSNAWPEKPTFDAQPDAPLDALPISDWSVPLMPANVANAAEGVTLGDLSQSTAVEPVGSPAIAEAAPQAITAVLTEPGRNVAYDLPNVSFIAVKPAPLSAWRRALMGLLALMLVLVLLAQVVWFYRDRLATHHPQLRPVLSAACGWVGCVVSPLMQLDAWTVDNVNVSPIAGVGGGASGAASATAGPSSAYRLTLSLRNGAAVALAVPAIELSLQDGNDVTVLRRVLSPQDMNIQRLSLGAGEEQAVNVSIALREPNGTPIKRIAGYRVIAFYP